MNSSLKLFAPFSFIMILITTAAFGQPGRQRGTIIPADLNGYIGLQAGNYNFVQFNQTDAFKTMVSEISKINRDDLAYFEKKVQETDHAFQRWLETAVFQKGDYRQESDGNKKITVANEIAGLQILSNQSYKGIAVPVGDFVDAVTRFKQSVLTFSATADSLSLISNTFPSRTISVGSQNTTLPSYRNVDFTKISKFYLSRIEAVQKNVANLPHRIKLVTGEYFLIEKDSGKGLSFDFPAFQISEEQEIAIRAEILKLRTWDPGVQRKVMGPYTLHVRQLIQDFIKAYGITERYSYNDNWSVRVIETLKEFTDFFYGRSLIRATYGAPLGVIAIHYNKQPFDLDKMFSPSVIQFQEEIVFGDKSLLSMVDMYQHAYETSKTKSAEVFGSGVDLFDRLNSAFTFLYGKNRLAAANKGILELLYHDAEEERILIQKGFKALKASLNKRYFGDPVKKAQFKEMKEKYRPLIVDGTSNDNDDLYGGTDIAVDGNSILGYFKAVVEACKSKSYALAIADEKTKSLLASTKIADRNRQRANSRLDDN